MQFHQSENILKCAAKPQNTLVKNVQFITYFSCKTKFLTIVKHSEFKVIFLLLTSSFFLDLPARYQASKGARTFSAGRSCCCGQRNSSLKRSTQGIYAGNGSVSTLNFADLIVNKHTTNCFTVAIMNYAETKFAKQITIRKSITNCAVLNTC